MPEPNPTRLPNAVLPQPKPPNYLTDDPEFAPAVLPSEAAEVRKYTFPPKAAPSVRFDERLRPFGTVAIVVWIASLTAAAIVRQIRRKHSS